MSLSDIYDSSFFSEYGSANTDYASSCRIIAAEIVRRFEPKLVVDWGCGAGLHADAIKQLGIEVVAVDGVEAPNDLRAPGIEIQYADISCPIRSSIIPAEYDLSLCLDVLEHMEEKDSAQALENITTGAELLLLSCAPPGQRGHHHVNEQPRRYWIKRLAKIGWRYDRSTTGAMERVFLSRRDDLPMSWMYHNICVYRPV